MEQLERFKCMLDECHEWPCPYPFSFIVPAGKADEAAALFPAGQAELRSSRSGKYVSVRAEIVLKSSDEALAIYERACKIEGIISL